MSLRKLDRKFVKQRADYVLDQTAPTSIPVNLAAIARFSGVLSVELRPMVIEGCIEPLPGGFTIYIKDRSFQSVRLNDDPGLAYLKPRQRFTLAHEIVHTFFYDLGRDTPVLQKNAPRRKEILERLCQNGAGQLIVPDRALAKLLNKRSPLSANLAVQLARKFGASPEVMIRRIDELEDVKNPDRALVLARLAESGDEAEIRAICFHHSLLCCLKRPKLYSTLREWSTIFSADEFLTEPIWNQSVDRGPGTLHIKKRPHSTQRSCFFLEIELITSR